MSKENKENNVIRISKSTLWMSISAILAVLLVISIFTGGFGGKTSATGAVVDDSAKAAQSRDAQKAPGDSTDNTAIVVEGRAFKGAEDAKVTIVEYSSFSCGYCNRVRATIDQILENYPDDVKIVYKHFTRGGTDSMTAQATECAGDQGKFWEMHDIIFDKGSSGDVKGYAKDIGLDADSFAECLDSGKYASRVNEDTSEGRSLGIRGTPSFNINGELVVGAQPYNAFQQVIDAELAK